MQLTGIHHLTAISAKIRENHRFYTQVMGMRLVKRSVNQDDVSAYHLFYADGAGHPGTDLTFFDWPVPAERRGTHSITRTHLRVRGREALEYWEKRLEEQGVTAPRGITGRDGREVLDFEDLEGQRLSLVDDGGAGFEPTPWERSPVPAEFQIRGLGPIVISVPGITQTEIVLTEALGMRHARDYAHDSAQPNVRVYEMGEGGPHAELHVAIQPDLPVARQGAGGVHHVAFRTPNEEEYHAWTKRLNSLGISNSGEIDRYWFRSLYFREPNGILFEIATDGPGFGVDEDPATLGEKVVLPPFLEPHRASIVASLKPID
ncbi:ring-cleaving dioxygenase [Longimicrobium sp.]|uniref:ring-cleaving dioxygenase n=1 Tax=Longimicrobium sp. TaxID=2029185 RepID=UPI002BCCD64A|nr:ring-cleaving dioxygenase [Longimicrobium sp.]HSU16351.1 ring-cleaving dioxygenase [Longimicrobium sp.]